MPMVTQSVDTIRTLYQIHCYKVEFPGGDITELAANIIAELMYVQCDVDGNEYLLLELIVDHRKDLALSVEDQKVVVKWRETLKSQQLVRAFVVSGDSSTL